MGDAENIALFDMDGTLCDYDKSLFEELEKIRSPKEKIFNPKFERRIIHAPKYIQARAELIKSREEWWANLPKLKLGWDILNIAKKLKFRIMILTGGSQKYPAKWSGKKAWINKYLGEDTEMTIASDKGIVYGKILVDDYPEFIKSWLEHRPRGLVIMPACKENENFKHPQVIRYTGKNLAEVRKAMIKAKLRK